MRKTLVTGAAGFIGYHVVQKLLQLDENVVGLDNINDYYSVSLKYARLSKTGIEEDKIIENEIINSTCYENYRFVKLDLKNDADLNELFEKENFTHVINLAAQAGVRYSIKNPKTYIVSNIMGFANVLEACRHNEIKHLTYASSSSVYGLNEEIPFSTKHNVDHPISLYAASKKSNELMAHTYSHLYKLPTTGLRFFTVYGPWGRPDMAYFSFTKDMLEGSSIKVFNNGEMSRDFTYVDDIVEGVVKVMNHPPEGVTDWSGLNPDPSSSRAPYKIYNIGNSSPVKLLDFIRLIERSLGIKADKIFMPIQPGDVEKTYADVEDLVHNLDYKPNTGLDVGIDQFVKWYRAFYNV